MIDALMWALTAVALPALFLVPSFLFLRGLRREALFLLLTIAAAGVLAVEIQFVTLRPRPNGTLHFGAYFPSFPSGHAAIAFSFATFLSLLRPRFTLPLLLFASLIAISRVYLGHHHQSDVLLGAILGAATAALAYGAFYRSDSPGRPRWSWWLWPQLALVSFAFAAAYLDLARFDFLRYPYADKVLHLLLFGLLAFLLAAWFNRQRALIVCLSLAALATLDEILQSLVPWRSFDPFDLACTLAGIAAAVALSRAIARSDFARKGTSLAG